MLYRIPVDVIYMGPVILFRANTMFPKPTLPYSNFISNKARSSPDLSRWTTSLGHETLYYGPAF